MVFLTSGHDGGGREGRDWLSLSMVSIPTGLILKRTLHLGDQIDENAYRRQTALLCDADGFIVSKEQRVFESKAGRCQRQKFRYGYNDN